MFLGPAQEAAWRAPEELLDIGGDKAAAMLHDGEDIATVAARAGYHSPAAFSKAFRRAVGMAPGAYRRDANGSSPLRA